MRLINYKPQLQCYFRVPSIPAVSASQQHQADPLSSKASLQPVCIHPAHDDISHIH